MPKISVIVPVYNAEKYLERCISSIANQTLDDIEILAINDGSLDSSLNLLDSLSLKYKGKLRVFDKPRNGAGSARNLGLDNATGEFIKFVDADDYLRLDILDKMYTIAKENNVLLVRGNYKTIIGPFTTEDKCSWSNIKGSRIVNVRENKNYIVTETPGIGNKLISARLMQDLRFPEGTKWEDLAIMPVVLASSERVFHLDEPVYNYRVNMNTTIKDFIFKVPGILDIIKCVDYLETEMQKKGLSEEYQKQIESIYILHTLYRVENAMLWVNFPRHKKEIVISSLLGILDAKYPDWENNEMVALYQKQNSLFGLDMRRLDSFTSQSLRNVDVSTAKNNIRKVLKKQ